MGVLLLKISSDFQLQEYIHPDVFGRIGNRSQDFLHPSLAPTVQRLRDAFGPITINDWLWGGDFKFSGLRPPDSDVGAFYSSHRFGCAADLKFADIDAEEVQQAILGEPHLYGDITRMENTQATPTWLHLEVGVRNGFPIKVFTP